MVEWQVASRQSDGSYGLESFKTLGGTSEIKLGRNLILEMSRFLKGFKESLPEAVRLMKKHMVQKQKDFDASLQEKLEKTMELLRTLQERQFEQLELILEKQLDTVKDSKRKKRKQEINGVFDSYRNWVENTLSTEPEPYIQVLAAMCPMNAWMREWIMADLQTYSGIVNENEFFSHHYFSSEFQNNIKDLLDEWNSRETDEEGFRSPVNLLKSCRKEWFINLPGRKD